MLRLTLAQMRRSIGRLAAAGIAIVIGTAFVAATLLAGGVITRTSTDVIAARYADADLVVTGTELSDADIDVLGSLPAVATLTTEEYSSAEFTSPGKSVYLDYHQSAPDPRLDPLAVLDGALPVGPGEVGLPEAVAERLAVTVGDTLDVTITAWTPDAPVTTTFPLRVTAVMDDPMGAFARSGGSVVVTPADAAAWAALQAEADPDRARSYRSAMVLLAAGTEHVQAVDQIRAAVPEAAVRTVQEQAEAMTGEVTGDSQVFTTVVLGFAAVALLVAALVISNTLQVLVAQRTRTLALLRCVGATTGQLRRSVLLESTAVGLLSSVTGVAAGIGLAQGTLMVLAGRDLDVPLPSTVTITLASVLAPVVVGTLVTVLAALTPARAASRVAPLAALRPAENPKARDRGGRARLVMSALLTVGGLGLLVLGLVVSSDVGSVEGVLVGLLGGALSFTGVLVGAVFWVPRVVGAVGRLVARLGGPAAALAAANTVRNPRRTAATSSALLIGVTLVAMFSAGAANARTSLSQELDDHYPVDVALESMAWTESSVVAVPPTLVQEISEVRGVAEVVPVLVGAATISSVPPGAESDTAGAETVTFDVVGVDPAQAAGVIRSPGLAAMVTAETVVIPYWAAGDAGLADGDPVWLVDGDRSVELRATVSDGAGGLVVMPSAALRELVPQAPVGRLWVGLSATADAPAVVPAIEDVVSGSGAQVAVLGAAVERASLDQVIDTLLAVVVGLLAVAVIIALIGVANTLSLSVIERRRESATLRAIGLTRAQLRGTLAIEGLLIAGVGAALGVVIGTFYGWVGARTVLSDAPMALTVPWSALGLVLAVALVAGLAASVLPGRSAARTSPVAALAVG